MTIVFGDMDFKRDKSTHAQTCFYNALIKSQTTATQCNQKQILTVFACCVFLTGIA